MTDIRIHVSSLLDDLAKSGRLLFVLHGDRLSDALVVRPTLPWEAGAWEFSWLAPGAELEQFGGVLLLMGPEAGFSPLPETKERAVVVSCDDPRRAMAELLRGHFRHLGNDITVHPKANVHPSAVLGPYGQGYVDAGGAGRMDFPQVGGILIEEDVTVGPCSTIMCAAIGYTVIEKGARVGNGVNVGHGARIGRGAILTAHATVGGSSVVGERAVLWQNVCVANGVHVGDDAILGMGAVVLRDVPAGETWVGNPARPIGRGEGI